MCRGPGGGAVGTSTSVGGQGVFYLNNSSSLITKFEQHLPSDH